ncbi:Kiwa anti-phage protein KwaB-like domain-containing protein [Chryseobacterium sp. NFX27]|uniref:Kiwa anti-phage protein KwaB-like domain-containing protein n=1 Tax=Chryseobacterium sp. NFX27 TaxID=2819618 RepID=UPI003CEEFA53
MDKSLLIDVINKASVENLNMYFVTRILKEGVRANSRVLEKFDFKVYQIEITEEVRKYLYDLSLKQFKRIEENDDLHFFDYDIVADETQHLFTYQMENKIGSFSDVVYNQLNGSPQKITDLNEILQDETLWAYCTEFELNSNKSFYTFRKISPGKVGVEKQKDQEKKSFGSQIRTYFDTNTNTLSLLKSETVYLDKQIDCIFYEETFYVLKKFFFEQLVGLQEEYKRVAEEVANSLARHECFGDIKLLSEKIEKNSSMHKKLIKLQKIGNLNALSSRTINKLEKLGRKKNAPINIKDGKIQFESEEDIDNVIKLLCDYFKTGDYSGKSYGTYAGKVQIEE